MVWGITNVEDLNLLPEEPVAITNVKYQILNNFIENMAKIIYISNIRRVLYLFLQIRWTNVTKPQKIPFIGRYIFCGRFTKSWTYIAHF